MARGAAPPQGPPRLLQRLYGAANVLPLGDLVLQLARSSREAAALPNTLVQPFDHSDYADALLARTFCVVRPGAPPLNDGFSLRQASTQLLHRAIEALLQAPQGKNNVLCYGYRKKRPTATGGRALVGTAGTEAYHANSVTDSLLAPPWQLLLSRIGDTLMLYLFLHVSMFSCLGNDTCIQLAGPSAVMTARAWKRTAAVPRLANNEQMRGSRDRRAAEEAERPLINRNDEQQGGPGTQEPFSGPSSREPAQQAQPAAEEMQVEEPKARRRRPSSWQRRKARAAAEAASAAAAVQGDSLSAQRQGEGADTPLEEDLPPTQPLEDMEDEPQEAPTAAPAAPSAGSVRCLTQWPRYMLKPSEMVINRISVFYCSSFPSKPGLPAKHILNVIQGREDAGQVLYCAIFDPKQSPVGRAANLYQSRHLMVPRPPLRVPPRHAHLIPALQSLVHRASKCPFGKLLNLYCPLPRHMRKEAAAGAAAGAVAGAAAGEQEPRPLVADDEKDLDILMDELYAMEQAQHAQQDGGEAAGAEGSGAVAAPPAAAPPHGHRRRTKLTGLSQLVMVAESQLDPAIAVGSGPHAADAVGSAGAAACQRTQASKLSSVAHDGHSQGFVLAAQPLEAHALLHAAQEGAAAPVPPPAGDQPPSVESLATCFVPHSQVTGFVWAAVRRIVPRQMLGNGRCRRALRSAIAAFVSLRRYEQMSVHQLLQHQEVSGHDWLSPPDPPGAPKRTTPPSAAAARQRTLALWVGWLFTAIVVPLLRAHFFCTESEAYRQQVFYYRKPVWRRLAAAAMDGLAGTQFAPLSTAKAKEILERRKLGVAKLRLLPKRVGMRCIVNMGAKTTVRFKAPRQGHSKAAAVPGMKRPREEGDTVLSFPSINSQIAGIHQILKLEVSRQPGVLGASIFAYDDAYCRFLPYVRAFKAAAAAEAAATASMTRSGTSPSAAAALRPYLVSVDVSRAFDHVDVATLLDLVNPLFRSEQYLVLKYTELVGHMGDVRVVPRRLAVSADGTGDGEALEAFPSRASGWAATRKGKLYVDGVVYERISRTDALRTLRQHLTANLVRLKRTWHYQCRGIAQGGSLSTLLCSLYLAHVEKTCLAPVVAAAAPAVPPRRAVSSAALSVGAAITGPANSASTSSRGGLTALAAAVPSPSALRSHGSDLAPAPPAFARRMREHSLLLRLVDDWLLITVHPSVAQAAARGMLGGIPAYNVAVNPAKTKLSFTLTGVPGAGGSGGGVGIIEPSLYVGGDGARFIKWCGLLINSDNLEVQGDYTRYAGEHIATSMTLPPKRALGSALASKLCVYLRPKIHPLLLDPTINSSSTIRLNIYQAYVIGAMKFHCYVRAMPAAPAPGSNVLMDAIEAGIYFMVKITRPRRVGPTLGGAAGPTLACDPGVCPAHVRFLGLHAFQRVLRRKSARYGDLLAQIDAELAAPACARCAKALATAVDQRRSTILDAIIY